MTSLHVCADKQEKKEMKKKKRRPSSSLPDCEAASGGQTDEVGFTSCFRF